MPGPDEKDEAVKTPPERSQRTTPFGSGEATTGLDISDPALRPLAQRYDLVVELGRGGMGIVYQARDRETGDVVALKILNPEIASRPELIERFKAELLLARKITHKNVCRVHDLNRFGAVAAISMEYIEGESLRSLLERVEGLSVRQGLKIVRQVLAGVGEAHAQGVVHRDLKPENILLARDGSVKVMDFGIARSLESDTTKTGSVIGTPAYMSPEQVEGKPADARSDIYALGLILYEMFTGRPAFHAETPVAVALKHVHDTPPPPRGIEPDLPDRIDRAIRKCLEKNPKKRFQSVAELDAALAERAAPEVVPTREPVPAPHLLTWRRLDWILLVLGVLGGAYFLTFRERVFPASQMRLEADALSARQTAEAAAARLGRPFPDIWQAHLESQVEDYPITAYTWLFISNRTPQRPPWRSALPRELVAWAIRFRGTTDYLFPGGSEGTVRYALVSSQGRVTQFYYPNQIPSGYTPAPVEQRRTLARQAAEQVCGPLPAELTLRETAGGEQGASYTAWWRPKAGDDSGASVQVTLLAEKVVEVRCQEAPTPGPEVATFLQMGRWWDAMFTFGRLLAGAVLLVLFLLGRCYQLPSLWRRLPLAVLLGLIRVWRYSSLLDQPGGLASASSLPPWVLLFTVGSAETALLWLALVTAEHYLRRYTPEHVASYVSAWRLRLAEPAVGLAIVRGALAGLALVGLETALVHFSSGLLEAIPPGRKAAQILAGLTPTFVDPRSLGRALESFSPALYVVSAALFDGFVLGVIVLGVPLGWYARKLPQLRSKSRTPELTLASNAAGIWLVTGLSLHVVEVLPRPFAWFLPFALGGFCLAWLVVRYDVLTGVAAVATAVLWKLNYPLLVVLRDVGNAGHWVVFVLWGLVVLAGAAVGFRSLLDDARRRFQAAFE